MIDLYLNVLNYKQLPTIYAFTDKVDNSIENVDGQVEIHREINNKRKEMKVKHKKLREDFSSIEGRIKDPGNKEGKFEDSRVYHLWALAQKAGMNEQELESFRVGHVFFCYEK